MKLLLVGEGIYKAIYNEFEFSPFWRITQDYLNNKDIKFIIDIGASSGLSALMFLDYPDTEKIICLEPDEDNYSQLLINLKPYKDKISPFNFGIFYGSNEVKVFGVGDNSPLGYFTEEVAKNHAASWGDSVKPYEGKVFKMRELEVYSPLIPRIDLIKMDVEGSEYNIIQNSKAIHDARYLIISFHNEPYEEIKKFLEKQLAEYKFINISTLYNNTDILLERMEDEDNIS